MAASISTHETPLADWVEFFKKTNRNIFNQCMGNRRLLELIFDHTPKQGRVLEAGCGTALLSVILADCGFKVTALDYTQEILDYARQRVTLNGADLSFVRGDILKLSELFAPKHFDTICHSGVMEHFSDQDIVTSLIEQRKVSQRVIFSIPNHRNTLKPGHFGNERFMNNGQWRTLITAAGFTDCAVYGGYDLPKAYHLVLPGALFHRKLSFWWKWASSHSIFVCQ